jgi:hypothetical protein
MKYILAVMLLSCTVIFLSCKRSAPQSDADELCKWRKKRDVLFNDTKKSHDGAHIRAANNCSNYCDKLFQSYFEKYGKDSLSWKEFSEELKSCEGKK